MSSNNRNISEDPNSRKGEGVSGLGKGTETKGNAGSAANTRGENKPSHQGSSGGAKQGKDRPNQDSPQGSNANRSTTSRGADSTDKEFRNNQPNDSTSLDQKGKKGTDSNK